MAGSCHPAAAVRLGDTGVPVAVTFAQTGDDAAVGLTG
jgi:hypothetical protein